MEAVESAMALPEEERAALAVELLATLDGETDPGAERAWVEEITRRAERTARANEELDARKQDARREVLDYLGESAQTTPEEAEQIRREWQG